MNTDSGVLQDWVGRTEVLRDRVTAAPPIALAATLDHPRTGFDTGADLPAPWHWLYFLPSVRQSEIGADGHPKRGGFLPPVALPRRMWAGSQMRFVRPLKVGADVTRTSRIANVRVKEGRSGALVFVKVEHRIEDAGGLVLEEAQDIVYRDAAKSGEATPESPPAPGNALWCHEIRPDPVLLFRFSALTFNSHRIHYDLPYATGVEHYPALVVHGPLIATLLLDALHRELPDRRLRAFTFRAVRPLFEGRPFKVCGRIEADGNTVRLWAQDADGWLAMDASAELI
ncbi:FAS1-like dehydratase domain-containing protein [Aromatoleum petrolei]|uniref:Acyl-CoA dehydrogenase n=1 Tax=Aromatoleum petrolei TaxID=76116 RepID=A0ABX1MRF3_9RHOO|nr:MaoC family dehydratase N-terminal domain-containing protein [Aromatoleum petrolei]NMF88569.1 acyl-CoA dehydrogenase [Aromatoleum petrolei]QTQ34723.1 HotDog domain superfamily protein [Aromatoleum petrolei]